MAFGAVAKLLRPAHARHPPLFAERHSRGIKVGILHGLHLWAAQEVVEGVEGVRRPGHGLLGAGVAGGAEARTHRAQTLHVVHCAGHQVTWNRGNRAQVKTWILASYLLVHGSNRLSDFNSYQVQF